MEQKRIDIQIQNSLKHRKKAKKHSRQIKEQQNPTTIKTKIIQERIKALEETGIRFLQQTQNIHSLFIRKKPKYRIRFFK